MFPGEGVLRFQNLCLILLQNDHAIKYVQIKNVSARLVCRRKYHFQTLQRLLMVYVLYILNLGDKFSFLYGITATWL